MGPLEENCLKRLILKNVASIQVRKYATFDPELKNQFSSKQILQILQPKFSIDPILHLIIYMEICLSCLYKTGFCQGGQQKGKCRDN